MAARSIQASGGPGATQKACPRDPILPPAAQRPVLTPRGHATGILALTRGRTFDTHRQPPLPHLAEVSRGTLECGCLFGELGVVSGPQMDAGSPLKPK